jgi:hypothetical protein
MSRPTKEQVQKYELEHKALFCSLVIANNLWLAMPGKYGFNPKDKTTKKYKAWMDLAKMLMVKLTLFSIRQQELEKSKGVPIIPAKYYGMFLNPKTAKTLSDFAKSFIQPDSSKGIGFIILLIWGVILLVAFFTAAYIVDKTTVTTQDRIDLLNQTDKTCKELGIPPEKAAALITSTQQQATESAGSGMFGGFGSSIKWIAGGLAAAFILPKLLSHKTN